eukprot:SAG31_NODE_34212_length_335_cov_0.974576_1_plen_68_part_00
MPFGGSFNNTPISVVASGWSAKYNGTALAENGSAVTIHYSTEFETSKSRCGLLLSRFCGTFLAFVGL